MLKRIFAGMFCIAALCTHAQSPNCFTTGFTPPSNEINCFKEFSYNQSPGVNNINGYLLSKISQLMYTERLDFELRKLRNPNFPSASFRSSDLNAINRNNFECEFTKRFSHWFYDVNARPKRPVTLSMITPVNAAVLANNSPAINKNIQLQNNNKVSSPTSTVQKGTTTKPVDAMEKYLADSIAFEKSKPKFRFLNKQQDFINIANIIRIPGFDPELMVISTDDFIIIAWRGTDDVYKADSWEWIGTDGFFLPVDGDGPLAGAKMHAGFWNSFKIVRTALMSTLDEFEAKSKNKKIFVTGHSLGGGMAMITAPYLKGKGYNIGEVYSFAGPRVVGNQGFKDKVEDLLGTGRIQRFEYGVDFVTKLWSPALYFTTYKHFGNRHWLNAVTTDDDYNCAERVYPMTLNPFEYNDYTRKKIDMLNGDMGFGDILNPLGVVDMIRYLKNGVDGNTAPPKDSRGFPMINTGHHNPTFYVKKMYENLSATDKAKVPAFVDTHPYVYPGVPGNK